MIHDIRLQHFRSYSDKNFAFSKGVNVIVGKNGSGKTNLLEAILFLATGGSFRSDDKNLIQFNHPWARLDGNFSNGSRTAKLEISGEEKTNKSFIIDGKQVKRLSRQSSMPAVLFEPDHLQLLSREPSIRRQVFNDLLYKLNPEYKAILTDYRRALAQRNALLKFISPNKPDQLFVWNVRMSELGSKIALIRQQLLESINERLSDVYQDISNRPTRTEIHYVTKLDKQNYASSLLRRLEDTVELDKERGFTSSGPHRDDYNFILNDKPASSSASRGEVRSLLLALKIIEFKKVEEIFERTPILLLDDVFSELDKTRQAKLVEYLSNTQVIITSTHTEFPMLGKNKQTIKL